MRVVTDKLCHVLEIVLYLPSFLLLLQESDLPADSALDLAEFLQVLLYFPDFVLDVLPEGRELLFEFVKVGEDVLGEERKNVGVVMQVVSLVDVVGVALRTDEFPVFAGQLDAVVVLFPDQALWAHIKRGLNEAVHPLHADVADQVGLVVVGVFEVPR